MTSRVLTAAHLEIESLEALITDCRTDATRMQNLIMEQSELIEVQTGQIADLTTGLNTRINEAISLNGQITERNILHANSRDRIGELNELVDDLRRQITNMAGTEMAVNTTAAPRWRMIQDAEVDTESPLTRQFAELANTFGRASRMRPERLPSDDMGFFRTQIYTVEAHTVRFTLLNGYVGSYCNIEVDEHPTEDAIRVLSISARNRGEQLVPQGSERLVPLEQDEDSWPTPDPAGVIPMEGPDTELDERMEDLREMAVETLSNVMAEQVRTEPEPEPEPEPEVEAPECPTHGGWFVPASLTMDPTLTDGQDCLVTLELNGSPHTFNDATIEWYHEHRAESGLRVCRHESSINGLARGAVTNMVVRALLPADPDGYFVPANGLVDEQGTGEILRVIVERAGTRNMRFSRASIQFRSRSTVSRGIRLVDNEGDVREALGDMRSHIIERVIIQRRQPTVILDPVAVGNLRSQIYGPHCPRCERLSVRDVIGEWQLQCTCCGARWAREDEDED